MVETNWRKYQKRVLDELSEHLDDNHLHIIAPPGSGKTILGLEVSLRLNKPTLIFAPTISIKNQWIEKFCELFSQVKNIPDWISDDIRNPKLINLNLSPFKFKNLKMKLIEIFLNILNLKY